MTGHQNLVQVLVGVAALAIVGVCAWLMLGTPGTLVNETPQSLGPARDESQPIIVEVNEGDGANEIGRKLQDAGVIESDRLFRLLADLTGVSDDLAAGQYEFVRGETAFSAVQRISQGLTASLIVTVREGLRSEEIADLLEREGVVSAEEFLSALADTYEASFLDDVPEGTPLEGFLFPATYGFSREATGHDVVQQMLMAFDERYQGELRDAVSASDGLSLLDIVTLASIVEREAQVPEERDTIASVFANRLEEGIPLQADPTVQYAVGRDPASVQEFGYWKGELSLADLAIDDPYNTYINAGLPPGPIANPGLDALLAAAEPADSDFLFFVARPDGSHVFAETLEEHNANVCEIDPSRPEC